jgi:hypothetical protein
VRDVSSGTQFGNEVLDGLVVCDRLAHEFSF